MKHDLHSSSRVGRLSTNLTTWLFLCYHTSFIIITLNEMHWIVSFRFVWNDDTLLIRPFNFSDLFFFFSFYYFVVDVFSMGRCLRYHTHTHTQVELVYVYKFHIIHRPMIELTHYDRGTGYYCGASSTPSSPNLIVPRLNPSWSMTLCLVCCLQYISHLGWRIQQQEPTLAPISAASTCI